MLSKENPGFVGKTEELDAFKEIISDPKGAKKKAILLAGEAGMGKSTLALEFKALAKKRGMLVLEGHSRPNARPYFSFTDALRDHDPEEIFSREKRTFFEEVFLIDNSGKLMKHLYRGEKRSIDEDLFGSMLTAIQGFITDSFKGEKGDGLRGMEYEDMNILVEHGETLFLACVSKDQESRDMREAARDVLATAEWMINDRLGKWDGNTGSIDFLDKHMRAFIEKSYSAGEMNPRDYIEAERIEVYNRLLEALTVLSIAGENKGLLLVLHGLQNADSYTYQAIEFLSRNLGKRQIILVLTYRSDELSESQGTRLASIAEGDNVIKFKLKPFGPSEVKAYLETSIGYRDPDERFLQQLVKQTGGNPLFLREFVLNLIENRLLVRDGDRWTVRERAFEAVPTSMLGILQARLERLPTDDISLLEDCSILGNRFELLVVKHFSSVRKIDKRIHDLVHKGYLNQLDEPGLLYSFDNALMREAIYDGISTRWKRIKHGQVGEAIEQGYSEEIERVFFQLADHFSRSNQFDKAFQYSIVAGDLSRSAFALESAFEHYRKAVSFLAKVEETPETIRKSIHALNQMSNISIDIGNWMEGIEMSLKAMDLLKRVDQPLLEAECLRNLGELYIEESKHDWALEVLNQSLRISEDMGDIGGMVMSSQKLALVYWRMGVHDKAMEILKKAIETAMRLKDKVYIANILLEMSNVLAATGQVDESMSYQRQALEYFEEMGDVPQISRALNNLADNLMYKESFFEGGWKDALGYCDRALDIVGNRYDAYRAVTLSTKAEILIRLKKYKEARPVLEEYHELVKKLGEPMGTGFYYILSGKVYSETGDPLKGERELLTGLEDIKRAGRPYYVSYALFEYARILNKMDRNDEAERQLSKAIKLAQKIGAEHLIEFMGKDG